MGASAEHESQARPKRRWARVAIGLGSNLGPRREALSQAAVAIADHLLCPRLSPAVESEPEGCPTGSPRFVNAVLVGFTRLAAEDLLSVLKSLERRAGRRLGNRNAPRPLDCDLLVYDSLASARPELTLPHPRLHQRWFWLLPLATVDPDLAPSTAASKAQPAKPAEPTWLEWHDGRALADAGIELAEAPDGATAPNADRRPDSGS